ncbi:superkiller complex protein 2 isoform X2 [Dermacentor andersoni]|uniref:superkiller complex protein 2 isoform X2 n=1 Tax=Dermacentor andersoni TaxID=34620 RepID=UPI003B3B7D34
MLILNLGSVPISLIHQCFLSAPNINSLFSCHVSMAPSELKVLRNLTTGTLEGYEEVFTEEAALEDNEQVIDLTKDLLTVPPGFEEGMTFGSEQPSSEDKFSVRHVLNLADVLSSGEPQVSEESSLEVKQISDSLLSQTLDDAGLLENLPLEPVANVLNISNVTNDRNVCLEWAEQVDISKPMLDFHEKVADPAFSWPFELDTFQKKAIAHLENRDSVFVAAHTSAGKTVVAEYAIALSRRHMTRTIYTSPIKALSNEKYRDFKETFTDIGLITGDVQINKEASCLIMTTEILRSMLYNQSNVVADLEWVIFDECHYINDPDRGVVWEEVLIMLPSHVGLVLLSATVPNALSLANWIGRIKERKLYVICTTKRPVPLEHHLYFNQETFLILDATNKFQTASYMKACARRKETMKATRTYDDKTRYQGLIQHLRKADRLPAICFTLSRRRCDENAQLLQALDLTTAEEKGAVRRFLQNNVVSRLSRADQRLPQLRSLRGLLEAGFGVHHSGVLPILKEAVEMLFQRGLVKVLFATETFAMGVNMPARTVVFDSIRKHDGISNRDLLPAEYIQMAGRAGRRGKDETGTVLLLCKGDVPESSQLQAMMLGRPTELQSRFRVTYSMILNLKAQANKRVEDMMRDSFRENSSQSQSPSLAERCASLENELNSLAPVECTSCQELPFELLEEEAAARVAAWEHVLTQPQAARCLSPGRLLLVCCPEGRNLLGTLASLAPREKRLTLWTLADSQPQSSGKASLPWPLSKKIAIPDAALSVQEMTVPFSSILCIYAKSVKVDPKRMICTSTEATIAIAWDHPMQTHITVEALRTHIRHFARAPYHHLATLPSDRHQSSFSKTIVKCNDKLPSGFTAASKPSIPPWCLVSPTVHLSVPGIGKKSELSSPVLKQLSLLLLHERYADSAHIYTDGSTNIQCSSGAVVVPARGTAISFRTDHRTTSTSAELVALCAALCFVNREPPRQWSIFNDSKAALQSVLSALRRGPFEQLVLDIRCLLHTSHEKGHHVTFQWLPSHRGVLGNEDADKAAQTALEDTQEEAIPLSRSDAASRLRVLAREIALSLWCTPSSQTNRSNRQHDLPSLMHLCMPTRLRRSEATLLYRLWLGVAFTKSYSFRIGMADNALCNACLCEETLEHILCDCPEYNVQRQSLAFVLAHLDNRPLSVATIFTYRRQKTSQVKATKALLRFMKETGLDKRL